MQFANDKQRFISNLVFTSSWFQNKVARWLKPFDLSLQQLNVLRILNGAGDWLTMTDIKARMVDKTPNTTRPARSARSVRRIGRDQHPGRRCGL